MLSALSKIQVRKSADKLPSNPVKTSESYCFVFTISVWKKGPVSVQECECNTLPWCWKQMQTVVVMKARLCSKGTLAFSSASLL